MGIATAYGLSVTFLLLSFANYALATNQFVKQELDNVTHVYMPEFNAVRGYNRIVNPLSYVLCQDLHENGSLSCDVHSEISLHNSTIRQTCATTIDPISPSYMIDEDMSVAPFKDKIFLVWFNSKANKFSDSKDCHDVYAIIRIIDMKSCDSVTLRGFRFEVPFSEAKNRLKIVPFLDKTFDVIYTNAKGCDLSWASSKEDIFCKQTYNQDGRLITPEIRLFKKSPHLFETFEPKSRLDGMHLLIHRLLPDELTRSYFLVSPYTKPPVIALTHETNVLKTRQIAAMDEAMPDEQEFIIRRLYRQNQRFKLNTITSGFGNIVHCSNSEERLTTLNCTVLDRDLNTLYQVDLNIGFETLWIQLFVTSKYEFLVLVADQFRKQNHISYQLFRVDDQWIEDKGKPGRVSVPVVIEGFDDMSPAMMYLQHSIEPNQQICLHYINKLYLDARKPEDGFKTITASACVDPEALNVYM